MANLNADLTLYSLLVKLFQFRCDASTSCRIYKLTKDSIERLFLITTTIVTCLLELQNQLAKLESGEIRSSGLFFTASHASSMDKMLNKLRSTFITSTFPFNNQLDRNVSDISLCHLLEGSSVLSDHVDDEDT